MNDGPETRKRIFSIIKNEPGLHFQELKRTLDMATGTLEHNLRYLEAQQSIVSRMDGYYKRYYPLELSPEDRQRMAGLRQRNPRRIAAYLLLNPGTSHGQMVGELGMHPSTLSFHIDGLMKKGIVQRKKTGRETHYTLNDPGKVERILIRYRKSLLDDLVDTFLDTWLDSIL